MKIPVVYEGVIYAAAALAALLLLWGAWWAIIIRPAENARNAAESAAQATLSGARTEAAKDAGAVSDAASRAATATEDLTRKNRDEILAQPGAQQPVDPRLGDAGRRAICLRQSARNDPACKRLLGARP